MRRDPSWKAFREELARQLKAAGLSSATLAKHLGIEPEQARLWLYGRQRPPLKKLPDIAKALGLSEQHFPVRMGILSRAHEPGNALDLAIRVQDLEHERQHLLERLTAQGEEIGAALVVREAVERGWAVAVWPAYEGPSELRLHVADRLTFHQTVGPHAARDPLPDLEPALQRVGAVRRYPKRTPGWIAADKDSSHHYSINRFAAPHAPRRDTPLARVAAIGVYSLTATAWATDVAAHIAQALGFGLTSTRSLATTAYGLASTDEVGLLHRLEMLRYLLARPQQRYVWHHFGLVHAGGPLNSPLAHAVQSGLAPDVVIVRLRETDQLLKEDINTNRGRSRASPTLSSLKSIRTVEDTVVRDNANFISIDVDSVGARDGPGGPLVAGREACFLRSMLISGRVLSALLDAKWITRDELQDVPFVEWLNAHNGRLDERSA